MFLHLSVSHSVHRGEGCLHLGPEAWCLPLVPGEFLHRLDTPLGHTSPWTQTPLDTLWTHTPSTVEMAIEAVRILLERILVEKYVGSDILK